MITPVEIGQNDLLTSGVFPNISHTRYRSRGSTIIVVVCGIFSMPLLWNIYTAPDNQ
jgi:hypothetical protein